MDELMWCCINKGCPFSVENAKSFVYLLRMAIKSIVYVTILIRISKTGQVVEL